MPSELSSAPGFDDEALEQNRVGVLTPAQRDLPAKIRQTSGHWTRMAIAVTAAWIAIVTIIRAATAGPLPTEAIIAFLVIVAVAVAAFAVAIAVGRSRLADLRAGRLSTVSGATSTRERRSTDQHGMTRTTYELTVGDQRFLLPSQGQLEAFEDGRQHAVHFVRAPGTPLVMSAKRIA